MPALCHRSTSVTTDEPLCLAVLFGLDISKITRMKPLVRMAAFWRMLPAVPLEILFKPLKKLSIDGLRWAPATFLRLPTNDLPSAGIRCHTR